MSQFLRVVMNLDIKISPSVLMIMVFEVIDRVLEF